MAPETAHFGETRRTKLFLERERGRALMVMDCPKKVLLLRRGAKVILLGFVLARGRVGVMKLQKAMLISISAPSRSLSCRESERERNWRR